MSSDRWIEQFSSDQEFLELERQADLDGFLDLPTDSRNLEIDFLTREIAGLGFSRLALIGRGGTSHVFKATDRFGTTVAVKLISHSARTTSLRFSREVSALEKVQHSNIPTILAHGTTSSGLHYIVLQHIPGQRIDEYCRENSLSVNERIELLVKACSAIESAHKHGILHRDLKPSNVLVTKNQEVFVTDFGLARPMDLSPSSDCTGTSEMVGTLNFLAPESLYSIQGQIGEATDVFGIGGILFSLLTERPPLNFEDFVDAVQNYFRRLPSTVCAQMPCSPKLAAICMKCLAPHPRHRYTAVSELTSELECFLSGRSVKAKNIAWLRKIDLIGRHNPWLFRGACVALLVSLVCVITVFGLWRRAVQSDKATQESIERLSEIVGEANGPGEIETRLKLLKEIAMNYERIKQQVRGNPRLILNAARTDFRIGMAYQQLGQHDLATKNWTTAKHRFEEVLNLSPDNENARFGYFHSLYSLEEYADAASIIHSLNLDFENIEYLAAECNTNLNLAERSLANGRFDDGRPYLETGLKISQRLAAFPDPSGRFRRNQVKANTLLARAEIVEGRLGQASELLTNSVILYRQLNPLGFATASESAEFLMQLRFAMVLAAFSNDLISAREIYLESKFFFREAQRRFPQYPQLYKECCSTLREYCSVCFVQQLEIADEELFRDWEGALSEWESNATTSMDYWSSYLACYGNPWRSSPSAMNFQDALVRIKNDGRYPIDAVLGSLRCNETKEALVILDTAIKKRPQDPEFAIIRDAISEHDSPDSESKNHELSLDSRHGLLARTLSFERSFPDRWIRFAKANPVQK